MDKYMSSTACYHEYVQEDFQLTHGEAVAGIRYTDVPRTFPLVSDTPTISLIVIDGEIRVLHKGSPPGLIPLPGDAALLRAGDRQPAQQRIVAIDQ